MITLISASVLYYGNMPLYGLKAKGLVNVLQSGLCDLLDIPRVYLMKLYILQEVGFQAHVFKG
jgi:hypothetical protein